MDLHPLRDMSGLNMYDLLSDDYKALFVPNDN